MPSRKQLDQIGASLLKLGPRRLTLLGIVGLSLMLAVGIAAHFLSRSAMQAIYTGLTAQEVTRMTAALAEAGVPFDVNEQRTTVLVPFGRASRARSLLAAKGMPNSSRAGYELFDQMGSMGLTSFMQQVTRVRALEGEIARTIQTLDGVSAARVHLVLPEAATFRRERREPSASVLIRIDSRWQAVAGQTVRHIVASAVPGMKVEQVSVASTDGRLIATGGDDRNLSSLKLAEMEREMAIELEQKAGRTLATALGNGNYQVSVAVRLNVDRQQTNETIYDPKSRVERSVRVVKQSGSSEDSSAKSAVGVEANVPRAEGNLTDADKRRQREDRREELINYELNTKSVQTVREGYRLQNVAIAVVVNRKQIEKQLGNKADPTAFKARLDEIKRLVVAATGANGLPSESIEISSANFTQTTSGLEAVPVPGAMEYLMMSLGTIINALTMFGIILVVVLLGLRPLLRILDRGGETPPALGAIGADAVPQQAGLPDFSEAKSLASDAGVTPGGGLHGLSNSPAKKRDEALRERLQGFVATDEAKVAKVLKNWMTEARQA